MTSNSKNKLISSNYSSHGNYRALDYLTQQGDIYIKGQLIIAGQTMYGIINSYKLEAYNETDYNKFLNSFTIN